MRNPIISGISAMLFAFLLFHLGTAYVNWDLNPQNWSDGHRGFVAVMGGFFAICAGFAAFVGTKDKEEKS